MNGELVNGEPQAEDRTILTVVGVLDKGFQDLEGAVRPAGPDGDDDATLARLYAEVMGLMPYELEPVAPTAGAKARLMTLIQGDETQPAGSVARIAKAAGAEPLQAPAPRTTPRPTQEFALPTAPRRSSAGAASRPTRWPLALAAAFTLALLGLSFWLYSQVGEQRSTIAGLQQELSSERARSEAAVAQARQLEAASFDMRQKFSLVTSPAVLVGAMRPMGQPPLQPTARGVLFVASDHQHWYMELQGLEPVAAGKTYKLWFVANAGTVNAGSFSAQPGAPIELSSQHMPAGTKGILVTLENDPRSTTPTGPEILRAAGMVTIS
ncbi:MAG TPA: anti-sigma factor [Thermoanaerobaculia bacterium]|nr:anti-sigma factor [Thermoanaerobaculia bacterium]